MDKVKIKKRGGDTEDFNFDKLLVSIGKTGIPLKDSENIAKNIQKWILKSVNKDSITSSLIKDKVIEEMYKDFPAEADSYKAYKK